MRRISALLVGIVAMYYGSALFERFVPYRMKRGFQRQFGNPFGRALMRWFPGWAVIETTGRRSGQARRVPVGGRLVGDSFWLVAADPRDAAYVKNIEADPRVRVQLGRTWRQGVGHLLQDDDAGTRMLRINPVNGLFIWLAGREHLTIRIDLDPA